MGPTAVLRVGLIDVMIASHATYDWNDEQFQSVGLDARQAKFVVVKNPMNHQMTYGDFATVAFVLDTPGPTPATLKSTTFARLQHPDSTLDDDIPDLKPTICRLVDRS